jgi:hypothetical protein
MSQPAGSPPVGASAWVSVADMIALFNIGADLTTHTFLLHRLSTSMRMDERSGTMLQRSARCGRSPQSSRLQERYVPLRC